jgi:DNA-binding MarR family transcriptional regulator
MTKREDLIQEIVESLARSQRPPGPTAWKALDLSHAQMGMLFMLNYRRQVSPKQIAEFLGVSKSAVSQLLDPLVDKKLVSRQADTKDRRIIHLSLTPKGSGLLKKLYRLKFAGIRTALGSLDTAELSQLAALQNKVAMVVAKQKGTTR